MRGWRKVLGNRPWGLGPFEVALPKGLPFDYFVKGEQNDGMKKINTELLDSKFVVVWGAGSDNIPDRLIVGFADTYRNFDPPREVLAQLLDLYLMVDNWAKKVVDEIKMPLDAYIQFENASREGGKKLAEAGLGPRRAGNRP